MSTLRPVVRSSRTLIRTGAIQSARPSTVPRHPAPNNRVQRVPGKCVECGHAVVPPARGPIAKRCRTCTDLRRNDQQLRAYVVSAMRIARVLQRTDVAAALSVIHERIDEAPRRGSYVISTAPETGDGLRDCAGGDMHHVRITSLEVMTLETLSLQINNPPAAVDPITRTARTRNPSRSKEVVGARRRSTREA